MQKNIYIYADDGVGDFSLAAVQHYFSLEKITLISADNIINYGIPPEADVFVMPGGADRPYAKKLKGVGNQKIKNYVDQGGVYLGICAGAYYGCSQIEFQKNTPDEICEERELGFFQGTAIGCLTDIAPPYDETLKNSAITNIEINGQSFSVLYWGGCYFVPEEKAQFKILSSYLTIENQPPAIISCVYGKGLVILSGVHFEVCADVIKNYDFDNQGNDFIKSQLLKELNASQSLSFDDVIKKTKG